MMTWLRSPGNITEVKMKSYAVVLFFIIHSSFSSTYYPTDFKQSLKNSSLSGKALKQKTFEVLASDHVKVKNSDDELVSHCDGTRKCYGQKSLGYRSARRVLFGKLHLQEDNNGYFVRDVYCEKKITNRMTKLGPGIIPNNNVLNCEHTWPQSRFSKNFDKSMQKSDLHHLFPTDSVANSIRGNFEFGEVNGYPIKDCNASHQGAQRSFSGRYFEPPRAHRGNVARAIFYFSTRYKLKIRDTEEEFLRQWHEDDPIDTEEMERSNEIHLIQGNRNPFIDYPQLVGRISNF
jgi:deoxyribonuclease-1